MHKSPSFLGLALPDIIPSFETSPELIGFYSIFKNRILSNYSIREFHLYVYISIGIYRHTHTSPVLICMHEADQPWNHSNEELKIKIDQFL